MPKINNIYVSTSSSALFAAQAAASQLGWLRTQPNGEPWLMMDIHYKKAFYTYTPPNLKDSSVLIATTPQQVIANLPPASGASATPIVVIPPFDPYTQTVTLID